MHPMLDTLNFKIVAVGQSAAGKTSLIYKYIRGEFRLDYNVTLGVEFYTKIQKIGAQNIQLQIWDTAGQEAYRSIVRTFYRGAAAVLLVFALDSQESFRQLKYWAKQIKDNVSPYANIYLIGTKLDLNVRAVSRQQVDEFMKGIENISYIETSSKTGHNVEELFFRIGRQLHQKYRANKDFRELVNPREERMMNHFNSSSISNSNNKEPVRVVLRHQQHNDCC